MNSSTLPKGRGAGYNWQPRLCASWAAGPATTLWCCDNLSHRLSLGRYISRVGLGSGDTEWVVAIPGMTQGHCAVDPCPASV